MCLILYTVYDYIIIIIIIIIISIIITSDNLYAVRMAGCTPFSSLRNNKNQYYAGGCLGYELALCRNPALHWAGG